ncbi:MAG TPA: TonB-dependent receptor, partial [Polyangiaceae bacterium]|nr:TonB-dependent receptor [Polyangiaceae bacterium]
MKPLRSLFWMASLATLSAPAYAQSGAPTAPEMRPPDARPPDAPSAQLTKPPRLIHYVPPEVKDPPDKPIVILLKIAITAEGAVSDAEVLESADPAYDEPARAAARELVFEPAEIDGRKAPVRIQYRYQIEPPAERPVLPASAEFTGIVRDQHSKQPLSGVRIELDTGEVQTTGDDGRFTFSAVAPGTHSVTLTGPTFTPLGTEETLELGKRYDATYDVEVSAVAITPEDQSDFEVVIVASKLGSKISATEVSAEQGARAAGTGGDVVKVVENLPGVARSTVGSGQLVVWGASAEDTRVYVDGVHIPVLYHEGGFRSVIHSDLVRSVELQPGGYGASYGRGLGGLVTVGLKPLDDDRYRGSVQLDIIDTSASLRGPLPKHFNFGVAARRSHLDSVLRAVSSEDVGEFVPIPKYWDGQARLGWSPGDGRSLEVGTLLSSDRIERNLNSADPNEIKRESKTNRFARVYLHYQTQTENSSTRVSPFVGTDRRTLESRFGAVPAEIEVQSTSYGLRANHSVNVAPWLALQAGLDAQVVVSSLGRRGSTTTPPREGDLRVFGQQPADQVNSDDWSVTVASLAPYIESDFSIADKLHIIPGLRIEPQLVRVSRVSPQEGDVPPVGSVREDTGIDPRLSIRWNATNRISAKAAMGVYHQPPLPEDLSSVFGNPNLGFSRATHYLIGGAFRLSKPISLEVTSFYSKSSDLAIRSPLATPRLSQALIPQGQGRAYGTQFLLRYDLIDRFFGWASFSMIRSERSDANGNYRLFDFDQTFVFTALGSYDLGAGFEFGGRFRYSSGYPRTAIESATYDSRLDAYQPVFGAQNDYRIPAFYAFDVRVAKRFE